MSQHTHLDERTAQTKSGFTIIETIIVLAIGGLILSIIIFALPALQRNSRNNQRKQEVTSILQAISRYELNHSGTYPTGTEATTLLTRAKLKFYPTANVTLCEKTTVNCPNGPITDPNRVLIANYALCDVNDASKTTNKGAGYNNIAALYAVETGGTAAGKCQQL